MLLFFHNLFISFTVQKVYPTALMKCIPAEVHLLSSVLIEHNLLSYNKVSLAS